MDGHDEHPSEEENVEGDAPNLCLDTPSFYVGAGLDRLIQVFVPFFFFFEWVNSIRKESLHR